MTKTYGVKSLTISLLISLGLIVLAYAVIRHSIGFLVVTALIVAYDIWAYSPRYQLVSIGNGVISFRSVNPLRKRIDSEITGISKVTLQSVNEVYYKVIITTGSGDNTISINMYPSEFKALTHDMKSSGLTTETISLGA